MTRVQQRDDMFQQDLSLEGRVEALEQRNRTRALEGVWYRVGGTGGAATFMNSWTHYDLVNYGPAEIRKIDDRVEMRGGIKGPISAGVIAITDPTWWPQRYTMFPKPYYIQTTGANTEYIQPTPGGVNGQGTIFISPGYLAWIQLDHVYWFTTPMTTS